MYLIIFEDSEKILVENYTEEDLSACEDGLIDIVDISNPKIPKEYYDHSWNYIKFGNS